METIISKLSNAWLVTSADGVLSKIPTGLEQFHWCSAQNKLTMHVNGVEFQAVNVWVAQYTLGAKRNTIAVHSDARGRTYFLKYYRI